MPGGFPPRIADIVVVAESRDWQTVLEREFGKQLTTAVDFDEGLKRLACDQLIAIIVELNSQNAAERCERLFNVQPRFSQSFFAIGDDQTKRWLPLIRVCGWSGYCASTAKVQNLVTWIGNCRRNRHSNRMQAIEEQVAASLPWRPVE